MNDMRPTHYGAEPEIAPPPSELPVELPPDAPPLPLEPMPGAIPEIPTPPDELPPPAEPEITWLRLRFNYALTHVNTGLVIRATMGLRHKGWRSHHDHAQSHRSAGRVG